MIAIPSAAPRAPRLGFLGVGWIGRHRLGAMVDAGAAEATVVADASPEAARPAAAALPGCAVEGSLEALPAHDLDGVVIAIRARHTCAHRVDRLLDVLAEVRR